MWFTGANSPCRKPRDSEWGKKGLHFMPKYNFASIVHTNQPTSTYANTLYWHRGLGCSVRVQMLFVWMKFFQKITKQITCISISILLRYDWFGVSPVGEKCKQNNIVCTCQFRCDSAEQLPCQTKKMVFKTVHLLYTIFVWINFISEGVRMIDETLKIFTKQNGGRFVTLYVY